MSVVAQNLPLIRAQMTKIRMPTAHTKVYKDECVYSFDNPYGDSGLYLNLITMQGCGQRYLPQDAQRTGCQLYLHLKWKKVPKAEEQAEKGEAPTKLAIGVAGGFDTGSQFDIQKEHALVIYANNFCQFIALPCVELPEFLSNILTAVIEHEGMAANLTASTWDADDVKIISKYADSLVQMNPAGKRIPQDPRAWKDEATGATDNLWLNLSTGYIGGGRRNWDGTGGSGSALQHFQDTGKAYPLVVKLGTITPHGADVWSYADEENCMVIDPHLAEHLSFWGIDIMRLEKTEKTVSELEVSLNLSYDWTRLMEGQEKLELLSGAGLVGFTNIGSSCYLNSAMQCLLSIPELAYRYLDHHDQLVSSAQGDPTEDFALQVSKLAVGVLSDRYAPPLPTSSSVATDSMDAAAPAIPDACIVAPRMFKHLLGRGHAEFSSSRQQDVTEFLTYFLDQLTRAERTSLHRIAPMATPTPGMFEFHLQTKYKCMDSNEVKLTTKGPQTLQNMLELPIPLHRGEEVQQQQVQVTDGEDQEVVKRARIEGAAGGAHLRVSYEACVEAWLADEVVQMRHVSRNRDLPFLRSTRFETFPRILIIKLCRYYVGDNWVQKKIVAEVPMPEQLDLTSLLGGGLGDGEVLLDESAPAAAAVREEADEGLVAQLVSMGFCENGCRRAALATHNADVETAMNWVLEHMEDADFDQPPAVAPAATGGKGPAKAEVNQESVMMLSSMGYSADQATAALLATDQDIERAADWLFSHTDNLDAAVAQVMGQDEPEPALPPLMTKYDALDAGERSGRYTLTAVISHIGKNTDHGHYIAHIRKNGQWVLFNDDKVGKSDKAPLGHGFVYFYRRDDL